MVAKMSIEQRREELQVLEGLMYMLSLSPEEQQQLKSMLTKVRMQIVEPANEQRIA